MVSVDELEELARRAVPLLEQAKDHAGLVLVWYALGYTVANARGHHEDWTHGSEQALRHARLAGQRISHLFRLDGALIYGPRPADKALRTLDAFLPANPHPRPVLCRAWLLTMLDRFDEAAQIASEAENRFRELTGDDEVDVFLGGIAATAGRHEDAAVHLRRFCNLLEVRGLQGVLTLYRQILGRSLCKVGRHDEAEPLARFGREFGDQQDVVMQACWRQVQALVDSSRGRHTQAEQLVREAVVFIERTDALNYQGDALTDLADVLHAAGRGDEAEAALTQALERYERKMNLARAAQTRDRLAEFQGAAPR